MLAHSSFARRVFLTEWMTQDSREPNCATVYLAAPPSCADGWKSSRCTRGGVGAGSSLLSRPVDRCKQFRGSPSIPQYLNALLQLKPPPPKRGSVTEKGLLVQVFGLIQTFPIGKTRAPNAAVHSLSYFPWSGVSHRTPFPPCQHAPRPQCLYKSRNVHERPSFCHRDGNGTPSKRPRRTPSALSAGPIPRGPAPRTQKSPRRGPVRCLQGGLGKRTGPRPMAEERPAAEVDPMAAAEPGRKRIPKQEEIAMAERDPMTGRDRQDGRESRGGKESSPDHLLACLVPCSARSISRLTSRSAGPIAALS